MKRAIAAVAALALAAMLAACSEADEPRTSNMTTAVDPSAAAYQKWLDREPNKAEDIGAWERWYVAEPGGDPIELENELKAAAAGGRPGAAADLDDDVMDGDVAVPEDDDSNDTGGDPGPQKFGTTFTYSTGLEVSVSKPEKFTPSDTAAMSEGNGTPITLTITIVNDSDEPYDPTGYFATASSGGEESESIVDDGVSESPTTTVQPGKSITWKEGYKVLDPDDVTFDIEVAAFELGQLTYVN